MVKTTSPENKVKKAVLSRLDQWQRWGVVLDYDDVSNLGRGFNIFTGKHWMRTKKGKRDVIALVKVKNIAWVCLFEIKAPDGGNWSKEQQDYSKIFAWIDNVHYEVVKDPKQIDITLDRISGRSDGLLKEMGT